MCSFLFTSWSTLFNHSEEFVFLIYRSYWTFHLKIFPPVQQNRSRSLPFGCLLDLSSSFYLSSSHQHQIHSCYYYFKPLTVRSNKNNKRFYFTFIYSFYNVLFFIKFEFLICITFPSLWSTFVFISCKASLLVTNSLNFCLRTFLFLLHVWSITSLHIEL